MRLERAGIVFAIALAIAAVLSYAFLFGFVLWFGPIESFGWTAPLWIRYGLPALALTYIWYRLVRWILDNFIEEVPLGWQAASTFFGYVIMEIPHSGPILVLPWRGELYKYPTGEIQIEMQAPPKDRTISDPNAERPFLPYQPFQMSEDGSVVKLFDELFRFNFANYETGIRSMIELENQRRIARKRERLGGRELSDDEERETKLSEAECEAIAATFKERFPREDPYNNTIAVDTRIVSRVQIRGAAQFTRIVGSIETLSRNIASITQSTLQDKGGRYTLAMALFLKSDFQEEMRLKIEEAIRDTDNPKYIEAKSREQGGTATPEDLRLVQDYEVNTWAVNLKNVVIPNWGISYATNKASDANVQAGFYLQERTKRGAADAGYTETTGKAAARVIGEQEIQRGKGAIEAARAAQDNPAMLDVLDIQKQVEMAKAFAPPEGVKVYAPGNMAAGSMAAGFAGGFEHFSGTNFPDQPPQPRSGSGGDGGRGRRNRQRGGNQAPQPGPQDQGTGRPQQAAEPPAPGTAPNQRSARQARSPEPPERGSSDSAGYSVE